MPAPAAAHRIAQRGRRVAKKLLRRSGPRARGPLLSVIVPVYNVEAYLQECLDSLQAQTWPHLQIIIVDDGSTDSSVELALRYTEHDPRFTLVHRPNGGLGAARNTGVAHASGTYLTFVDSDDVIPRHAYAEMVASLERSGSDLCVGKMLRLRKGHTASMEWAEDVHEHYLHGVDVREHPRILRDFYSPNKVYRSSFWKHHGFAFREGVLFEDQPLITQIYSLARHIDILRMSTYLWRQRDDRSSLSQDLQTLPRIEARMQAVKLTRDHLESMAPDLVPAWHWTLVEHHFPSYLEKSARQDRAVLEASVRMVRELLTADQVLRTPWVSAQNRVLCYLAARYGANAVAEFVEAGGRTAQFSVEVRGNQILARLPLVSDGHFDVPTEVLAVPSAQCRMRRWVNGVWRDGANHLVIAGRAYLDYVDPSQHDHKVELVCSSGRPDAPPEETLVLPTELARPDDFLGPDPKHRYLDYAQSDFTCRIDVRQLAQALSDREETTLHVYVRVSAAGRSRTARLDLNAAKTMAGAWMTHEGNDGRAILVTTHFPGPGQHLRLRVWRPPYVATSLHSMGRRVSARVQHSGEPPSGCELVDPEGRSLHAETLTTQEDAHHATLSVLLPEGQECELRTLDPSGESREVTIPPSLAGEAAATALEVKATRRSTATLVAPRRSVVIDAMTIEQGGLRLAGWAVIPGLRTLAGRLQSPKARGDRATVDIEANGRFSILLPFDYVVWGVVHHGVLPSAEYHIVLEDRLTDSVVPWTWEGEAPVSRVVLTDTMTVSLTPAAGHQVALRARKPQERDPAARAEARAAQERWSVTERPVRDAVLFHCLRGDVAGDSQVIIHHELSRRFPDLPLVWSIVDHAVPLPAGAKPVLRGTTEWYEAWAGSRWICLNHELPKGFNKARGQTIIQTYHGHPFKLMGKSRWQLNGASSQEIERTLANIQWDFLVAPSPEAAKMYAEEFPTGAEILEVGHPRNDPLTGPRAQQQRERARDALGLAADETAILYAPTWRDYAAVDPWKSKMVDFLDPAGLTEQLGPGFKLLLRGHPAHRRHNYRTDRHHRVVDVTDHPDINDLILASDVGVFDYSSIRFDYSVTHKPMVFFVPDEQLYLGTVRGLLPFEETAPGPRLHTTSALVDALLDLHAVTEEHAQEYAEFRARFNPWEDGAAGRRLVDRVFAPHLVASPGTGLR